MGNASFHAFVVGSTQHSETDPNDFVDGAAVCAEIKSNGFDSCVYDLQPYDGAVFLNTTKGLAPFQLVNGLYPHRMASFFSTISRCLALVHEASLVVHATDPHFRHLHRLHLQGRAFDNIVVTRLEVAHLAFACPPPKAPALTMPASAASAAPPSLWERAGKFDLVVARPVTKRSREPLFEDRLFFGSWAP